MGKKRIPTQSGGNPKPTQFFENNFRKIKFNYQMEPNV